MDKADLIAPAGNMECARAAVANGADAVYFGLEQFNARMRAANFHPEELPGLVAFLHRHGVKAYCTLNTLIFTDELAEAERQLLLLEAEGVDAVILQDLGVARLAQALGLRMEVHASTQMTLTSAEGVRFVSRLGVRRVILARETSLRELGRFDLGSGESDTAGPEALPALEVFVHGALCVAYSGQCLTSEALGQRSANRGECAQACRLPYELVVDGALRDLGDRRFLLSPQDLAAAREIPELLRLGITGFKIEGRLKSPDYVAAATQAYRRAIDAALAGAAVEPTPQEQYRLEMTFTRGFYTGWMHGMNHQRLVHGRFGKKRGPFAGVVRRVGAGFVEIDPQCPLQAGDGVVFDGGGDTDREEGGRIWQIQGRVLHFRKQQLDFSRILPGHRVWKTSDPRLERELRRSYQGSIAVPKKPLDLEVLGAAGEPLAVRCGDQQVLSRMPLQPAVRHPLTVEVLRAQLGRLGDTPYALGRVDNRLQGEVLLPLSEMNRMRRELVALLAEREERSAVKVQCPVAPRLEELLHEIRDLRGHAADEDPARLHVLVRSEEQLEAALEEGCASLLIEFEDLRRYAGAVERVRCFEATGASKQQVLVFLAPPRIHKAGETGFFRLCERASPDGVLIRNLGALEYFRGTALRCIGDYTLNVANPLTAELLIRAGLERLTVSYDLDARQVVDLLRAAPPPWFELVIHQHLPMFHMEHCVFAAFLSQGVDHTDCGRPCDVHRLALRDRVGTEHPVKADVGCRNTVFHARAQSGAAFFVEFLAAGVRDFRVELLDEDAARSRLIIRGYRELLAGREVDPGRMLSRIRAVGQLGVTSGTLTVLS